MSYIYVRTGYVLVSLWKCCHSFITSLSLTIYSRDCSFYCILHNVFFSYIFEWLLEVNSTLLIPYLLFSLSHQLLFFFLPHLFPVILLFIFTKKEWFLLFLCISTQEYFQELNMTKCVSCIFSTLSSLWHYFSLFFHTFIDWILTSLSVVFIMNITTADYDVHSALSAQHFLHVHSDKD